MTDAAKNDKRVGIISFKEDSQIYNSSLPLFECLICHSLTFYPEKHYSYHKDLNNEK